MHLSETARPQACIGARLVDAVDGERGRRAVAGGLEVEHARGGVGLRQAPEEGRRQAQRGREQRLVDRVVRDDERGALAAAPQDLAPRQRRAVPQLPARPAPALPLMLSTVCPCDGDRQMELVLPRHRPPLTSPLTPTPPLFLHACFNHAYPS